MRVDFYQLGDELPERAIPQLAAKVLDAGERLLVISDDAAQLDSIARALWAQGGEDFLANGMAGGPHDARQPILLSSTCDAANGARLAMIADGRWRDGADGFQRVLFVFGDDVIDSARACWRMLGERDGIERHFKKREGGRWRDGP